MIIRFNFLRKVFRDASNLLREVDLLKLKQSYFQLLSLASFLIDRWQRASFLNSRKPVKKYEEGRNEQSKMRF